MLNPTELVLEILPDWQMISLNLTEYNWRKTDSTTQQQTQTSLYNKHILTVTLSLQTYKIDGEMMRQTCHDNGSQDIGFQCQDTNGKVLLSHLH